MLCSIPPWMWMAFLFRFMFFELVELFPPLTFALFGYLSFNTCSSITLLLVVTLTSTHIHISNNCLCFNNRLNLYYYHKFPMKHLLHLNKLRTICHFMSIQTIDVACMWRCLLWFLTSLCCLCGYHYGLLFLLFASFHIVICHPTLCVIFVNLPYNTICFC
jgi:hypothetical protein